MSRGEEGSELTGKVLPELQTSEQDDSRVSWMAKKHGQKGLPQTLSSEIWLQTHPRNSLLNLPDLPYRGLFLYK